MLKKLTHSPHSLPGALATFSRASMPAPDGNATAIPASSGETRAPGLCFRERARGYAMLVLLPLLAIYPSIHVAKAFPESQQGGGEVHSLWIVNPSFDQETLLYHCELENVSGKLVTAYTLQLETLFSDGSRSLAFLTHDFAATAADASGDVDAIGLIPPGSRRTLELQAAQKEQVSSVGFTVVPVAVVYEDLSSEGDASAIDELFRSREATQLARAYWLNELQQTRDRMETAESLRSAVEQLKTRLEGRTDSYFLGRVTSQNASARLEERAIASNLDRLLALEQGEDFEGRLASLIELITHEFENLRPHLKSPIEVGDLKSQRK